jgi:hypothetical protein
MMAAIVVSFGGSSSLWREPEDADDLTRIKVSRAIYVRLPMRTMQRTKCYKKRAKVKGVKAMKAQIYVNLPVKDQAGQYFLRSTWRQAKARSASIQFNGN